MHTPPKKHIPLLRFKVLDILYDPLLFVSGLGKGFKSRITNLAKLNDEPATIVDVGCGTGTQLLILREKYPQAKIWGIDPDFSLISKLQSSRAFATKDISFNCAHAESLPFEESSIDVCFSTLAFHHMSTHSKQEAFREIYRILKPDGALVLTDWGVSRFPFLRFLLIFEKQEFLNDHIVGLIPHYAEHAGFTQISETRVKFSGIWTWVFKKKL